MIKTSLLILLILPYTLLAQSSRSGDPELDKTLVSLDAEAKTSFGSFSLELSKTYSVSTSRINSLKAEVGMSGGDIYMSLEIARISRRSLDDVVLVYTKNKDRGWGYIAKELGIKPGSPEFHQLKGNAKSKGKSGKGNAGSKGKGKGKGKGNG